MRIFFLDKAPVHPEGAWTPPKELQHHVKALRFGAEETFLLVLPNGSGIAARVLDRRSVELLGESPVPSLDLHPVQLATAWPKGKRAEDLVIRACEAGVSRIQPTYFERSVAGREPISLNQRERLERLMRETCQQLGRPQLPDLATEPVPWAEARALDPDAHPFCLHPGAEPLAQAFARSDPERSLLLIGPEGGISPEEEQQIQAQEWDFVGLIPTILRIEAAGPMGAAIVQHAHLAS